MTADLAQACAVNDAYWAHITGTAACNRSCLRAWQRIKPRRATTDELLGADQDWLGGESVDDYMRRIRGKP